jgi:hypothetical protein
VSRRGLPPTEEPRIAVAIQHVPARAHLLPRLEEALDAPFAVVVTGDPELRDPWATYQQCLTVGADADFTHLLVIQDDALPVARFGERVAAAVAERPGELLCLYVPERPAYMGRAMQVAHQMGERFATIPGGMFTPLVAAVWPVWLAAECLAWVEATPTSRSRRCDDAPVARFLRTKRYRPLGVVPSLVEHDELTPSTLGLGRYPRHAAIMATD